MTTSLREPGIQTLHDQVVSLIAQRWAKAFQCKVTIKTSTEQNRRASSDQHTDITGWTFSPQGNAVQWIAEIETEDSLTNRDLLVRWKQGADTGVPFYLFVPRGQRELAMKQATAAEVFFNGVYEYCFVNDVFQVL